MNLGNLHDEVAEVIARGSSQSTKIPRWVRTAAKWLEQNYSFEYMRKFGEATLDPLAAAPNVLDLPNDRVKLMELVQPYTDGADGSRTYSDPIPKADRGDVLSIDRGNPSGWWQIGSTLVFDAKPQETLLLEVVYREYTDWPTDGLAEPTLITRYDNLLMAQALVGAWRELKDYEAMAVWTNERDMALRAVLVAEDEAVWTGQDLRMRAP